MEKSEIKAGAERARSPSLDVGESIVPEEHHVVRGLKPRHTQMIAIGGCIGTGLFVSSGQVLARSGPLFLLLGYCIVDFFIWLIVTAITELGTYLPVRGASINYYAGRFVSPSFGFAVGWLYWYSWAIIVPTEITAAGLIIDYWTNDVNIAVWITIMIIVILLLNVLPVHFYGETEFWFVSIKVLTLIGLLSFSFILFCGGVSGQEHRGFHYWNDPGFINEYLVPGPGGQVAAFAAGLIGAVMPVVLSPEMLIVTAGEMQNPRTNLPSAAAKFVWRILFFYIGGVLAIGVICPSNAPGLTSGASNANASPWVIALKIAGVKGLDSVVNAAILTSAWSAGNALLYLSSRSLYSLALAGNAPKIFTRCTKRGLPWAAVMASALFMPLSYLNCSSNGSAVFNWFVNLTNTSGFIAWVCCSIIFLRFRKAVKVQSMESDVTYRHWTQPWGAYACIAFFTFLCLINGFQVFIADNFNASDFLTAYVGLPIFLAIYFGHRVFHWNQPWAIASSQVDLVSDVQEIIEQEQPVKKISNWRDRVKSWI
ncbi:hypothetical protein K431DRAFT_236038 [Polychaeton citri CBS 116435]|uniref:Amino acid permease/ SLC12A domain-containing protein n=1 Tax=Polychaeton citri CBS 116435 TaxID=1314669 RepID=A0A9P4PYF9_9PEZI|nr:hypothetical protein K431DRAFT_236038 [Polychaeton citri CBS 116435]